MSQQLLVRIYLEESYQHQGKPAYQVLLEYLRRENYAGATILRGIEGFGRSQKIHSADILDISTDLPIVIEIIETPENVKKLKNYLSSSEIVKDALITEEKVSVTRLGRE